MDDDWFEQLVALAPKDGVWCVPRDTPTYLIVDRASGLKILGSPIFYAEADAEEHIRHTFNSEAAEHLTVEQRPHKDAHRR
jgi:hypothetical protein